MDHTKMNQAYLESSHQELSVRGPGFVVAIFGLLANCFYACLLGVQPNCV